MYAQAHEDRPYHSGDFTIWSKTRSYEFPFHHSDGVTLSLTEREVDTSWLTGSVPAGEGVLQGEDQPEQGTAEHR